MPQVLVRRTFFLLHNSLRIKKSVLDTDLKTVQLIYFNPESGIIQNMHPQLLLEISRMKKYCVFAFLRSFEVLKISNLKFLGKVCEKSYKKKLLFNLFWKKLQFFNPNFNKNFTTSNKLRKANTQYFFNRENSGKT